MVVVRTILHVDMDAFFVAVERRRRPELVGVPVVVGGQGRRGVVAAASYEARRYGVHSAMPMAIARRLCPSAVFMAGDHAAYGEASREVQEVFATVTPLVEPLALDEAFLDVTGARALLGDGVAIAGRLREDVRDNLGLACSVGVAPNKFLAKLASVDAKPRATPQGVVAGTGIVEIRSGEELAYLHPMPVERLWGVGPATLERLRRMGVTTVGDLAALEPVAVLASLGRANGQHLLDLAVAHDDRPVEPDRETKSIGHEETFETDLHELDDVRRQIVRMADSVASRLRAAGFGARTFTLKVRDGGFRTITRSATLAQAVDTADAMLEVVVPLLDHVDLAGGVRLLGVSASKFAAPAQQLSFDDLTGRGDPSRTIDGIRRRFGVGAIKPASTIEMNHGSSR